MAPSPLGAAETDPHEQRQREELIDDLIKDLTLPKKSSGEDEFLKTFNELVKSAEGQQHMQDVADIIDGKRPLK